MTRKTLINLVALGLLSSSVAFAQQTPPDPGTPPPPPRAFGRGSGPEMGGRDFDGGMMHSGLRIAPPGMWWKNPDLIQNLTLTAEQQKHMDDIFQQSRIQLIHLHASLEESQVVLEPMLATNPLDTAKVTAQLDKIADTRADLEKANTRMLLGLRSVLTPDQWTKLQSEMQMHRHMMMRDHDMKGDRPDRSDRPDRPEHSAAPASPAPPVVATLQ